MAPCLTTLDAPPEDLGLVLNTEMAAQKCLQSQFQGILNPLLAS